ncbi:hypothetical protein OEB99_17805 [Actinotalea sp. M2MS4P-6]|uniref:hypothetical protein n=1 Tax=Actinotalea sp. M2MS4P-6 TaxID=2983762 RepID=UPI0021E40F94|nr:hypothetical protein [Actinotalea sp. M2MS4P-6]MCV2396170.1 hypothetical protein [Actinotalea sp. M2MS4P-6]
MASRALLPDTVRVAARAVALGLAAGGRASLGVAAPVLARGPRAAQVLLGLAVAGELVGDKLPTTPDRTESLSLVGRAASGAIGAVVLARRAGGAPVPAALVGGAAAVAGSFLGIGWRRGARGHLPDLGAALIEDAAVLALAGTACATLPRRGRP